MFNNINIKVAPIISLEDLNKSLDGGLGQGRGVWVATLH